MLHFVRNNSEQHCHGFDAFIAWLDTISWDEIEKESGLSRRELEAAADIYAIVAGMAKETLPPKPNVKWGQWAADYGKVRDLIEASYPDKFPDFNNRLFTPGGFYKANKARERIWETESGKAEFSVPTMKTPAAKSVPVRVKVDSA